MKISGHLVSVATAKLVLVKAATDNTPTSGLGCAEIKLYLQKQVAGWICSAEARKGIELGLDVGSQITSL